MSRWDEKKPQEVSNQLFKYTIIMSISFLSGMALVLLFG